MMVNRRFIAVKKTFLKRFLQRLDFAKTFHQRLDLKWEGPGDFKNIEMFCLTVETDGKEASDKIIKFLHSLLLEEYGIPEVLDTGYSAHVPAK